ncbi:hypothetical protein HK102_013342 [Quaeritorhiza haematococci]|nr:hypothetical protein HK102_013342 [Quaeritorhiza haematococci]
MTTTLYDPFFDPFYSPTSDLDFYTGDVATRFPRHVGSRIMTTAEGDVIWRPAADVFETDNEIVAHIDLPGVPKEEVNVDITPEQITVYGHHKGVAGFESATSRVRERSIGRFRKIVRLPSGTNPDGAAAKYQDGMLEVKVPKTDAFKGKTITIG